MLLRYLRFCLLRTKKEGLLLREALLLPTRLDWLMRQVANPLLRWDPLDANP